MSTVRWEEFEKLEEWVLIWCENDAHHARYFLVHVDLFLVFFFCALFGATYPRLKMFAISF